jgi:hypothetical protein
MKFRIKHVLIATLVVAVFAYGLSFPTYYSERWFRFGAWAVAALLTVRAVARPAERKAIACGLITAASYLAVLAYYDQPTPLPTSAALDRVYPRNLPAGGSSGPPMVPIRTYIRNPNAEEFRTIGEYGFATIFGLIAAGLAVYWRDESTNSQEPKL